jgi:1,4-dihydroxy-2-naphthoate octaprenyltransferase
MIKSGLGLQKNYNSIDNLIPFMSSTLMFGRITGMLFVVGFLIGL